MVNPKKFETKPSTVSPRITGLVIYWLNVANNLGLIKISPFNSLSVCFYLFHSYKYMYKRRAG